ncbi:Os08g0235700 [Oryza sativa Japonica Group]|uniref:Os08g0235700 protein n=1 Tax=Oryza sativa subsp. japonica TaxID=39947 RepID=A0A0P0XDK9_ORYSJ|nr:Os08g0235700 [Oryza sativa Japonica Group]
MYRSNPGAKCGVLTEEIEISKLSAGLGDQLNKQEVSVSQEQALVVWQTEGISSQPVDDPDSQEEGEDCQLEALMDWDLQKGFVNPIMEDDEEGKCDIPTESDIEKMRAEEDELEDDNSSKQSPSLGGGGSFSRSQEEEAKERDTSSKKTKSQSQRQRCAGSS